MAKTPQSRPKAKPEAKTAKAPGRIVVAVRPDGSRSVELCHTEEEIARAKRVARDWLKASKKPTE
ncbi:MAG TPA: hypothetical protein VNI83_04085 [Vicinamibacterales bacterium]|nr:hypothetical protein [Vicinamibacterales bacterium]